MLGKSNEMFGLASSSEDNLKLHVIREESTDITEKNMYKETARRVIFRNCMGVCELDDKSLPNFNRHFYYFQTN